MKYIGYFFYWLIQCTYGAVQNFLGFCLFIKYRRCPHMFYHGAILTLHDKPFGGVSLGMFIFVNGARDKKWIAESNVHEYGHTVQSMFLGPLYLMVIGFPSMVWCNTKRCRAKWQAPGGSYYDFYPERGANRLGALVTGEQAPGRDS